MSVVLVAALCRVGLSLENPAVTNPIGSGTVPPTAYKSGLIPSANPIDTSGNLVITGNVAGGMHFRGVVPYSGVTNFSAPASALSHTSGAIDSFLRYSASSQDFGQRSGGITPYYSPTLTVTKMVPGTRGMVTTQAFSDSGSGAALLREQTGYYRVSQTANRPLSLSQQEMEKLIEADVARYLRVGEPVSEAQLQEQFWQKLRVPMEQRSKPADDQGRLGAEANVAMLLARRPGSGLGLSALGQEKNTSVANTSEGMQGPDVFERMKMQLAGPATSVEELTVAVEPNRQAVSGVSSRMGAGRILDTYKSFAAYSDDKFNRHIRAAEGYMKEGRYYRAADAYTLATIYKPNDPLGYAGKSQALFAAGEYMSSALFLARALEVFPEYAKVRVDLVGIIGDKDTVENRILEAREWLDKSKSGELEFLLSYVYYQLDRMEFAKQAIESAAKKMPDSPVVAAMKKVIDERTANP
jgi:tetratricopeptide (TPR) repeat protein